MPFSSRPRHIGSMPNGMSVFSQEFRDLVNNMAALILDANERAMAVERRLARVKPSPPVSESGKAFWVARLTGSSAFGTSLNARWQYQWEEVRLNTDTEWETFEGGKASDGGDPDTFALNLVEWNNDGQGTEGYGYDVSPRGSDMFSASVTTTAILTGSYVQMWYETQPVEDGESFQRAVFQAPNEPAVKVKCTQDTGIGGTG